jgi:hypothetical protein
MKAKMESVERAMVWQGLLKHRLLLTALEPVLLE